MIAPLKTGRSLDTEKLLNEFKDYPDMDITVRAGSGEAFDQMIEEKKALKETGEDFRIYIAGSLYLAGEIKGKIENDKL